MPARRWLIVPLATGLLLIAAGAVSAQQGVGVGSDCSAIQQLADPSLINLWALDDPGLGSRAEPALDNLMTGVVVPRAIATCTAAVRAATSDGHIAGGVVGAIIGIIAGFGIGSMLLRNPTRQPTPPRAD